MPRLRIINLGRNRLILIRNNLLGWNKYCAFSFIWLLCLSLRTLYHSWYYILVVCQSRREQWSTSRFSWSIYYWKQLSDFWIGWSIIKYIHILSQSNSWWKWILDPIKYFYVIMRTRFSWNYHPKYRIKLWINNLTYRWSSILRNR